MERLRAELQGNGTTIHQTSKGGASILNVRRRGLTNAAPAVADTSWIEGKTYSKPLIANLTITGASNSALGCYANQLGNTAHNAQICTTADQDNPVKSILLLTNYHSAVRIENNKNIDMSFAYAYWTDTGDIIFAGKNSKWYGYANIDGTLAQPGWTGDRDE